MPYHKVKQIWWNVSRFHTLLLQICVHPDLLTQSEQTEKQHHKEWLISRKSQHMLTNYMNKKRSLGHRETHREREREDSQMDLRWCSLLSLLAAPQGLPGRRHCCSHAPHLPSSRLETERERERRRGWRLQPLEREGTGRRVRERREGGAGGALPSSSHRRSTAGLGDVVVHGSCIHM
jgi:hypothetical protein